MANVLTVFRIVLSIGMLVAEPLSFSFYILYGLAGLSDILDGYVARKTHTVSILGSKLDTFADFVMFSVVLFQIIPILDFTEKMWGWFALIALVKLFNTIYTLIIKRNDGNHFIGNKIAGIFLFASLFLFRILPIKSLIILDLLIAAITALIEAIYLIK